MFDIIQPRYDFLAEALQSCPPLRVDVDHPAPDHGVARFIRTYHDVYDALHQTLRSTNRYEIHHSDGRVEHRIGDLDWHIYFPEELELLLEAPGCASSSASATTSAARGRRPPGGICGSPRRASDVLGSTPPRRDSSVGRAHD